MPLLTITRKQLADSRWSLLFSCLAFFALAVFWSRGVSLAQFPEPEPVAAKAATPGDAPGSPTAKGEGEDGRDGPPAAEDPRPRRQGDRHRIGFYSFFGVQPPERLMDREDLPTLLMQVAVCNNPLITLALLGWAVARGSAAVAGEIERGALDMTLSRPVRRSTYLSAQILTTLAILMVLSAMLVAGHLAARLYYPFQNVPSIAGYIPSTLMLMGFPLAIYGYTLAFSAVDLSRVRVGLIGLGITLVGIAGMISAKQYEYDWMEKISVFAYYWPVGITADWTPEIGRKLLVLYGIFAGGVAVAFAFFLRRDLPTSGG